MPRLAQAAGIGALEDREFLHKTLECNARGMRFLASELRFLGLEPVPSAANFLMIPNLPDADGLTRQLLERGVIVRPLRAFGIPHAIRISSGSEEDNQLCVDTLKQLTRSFSTCLS